jgi:hypothetical protein
MQLWQDRMIKTREEDSNISKSNRGSKEKRGFKSTIKAN